MSGDREGLPARPGRGRADPLPVRPRTPGGTHRPAHHRAATARPDLEPPLRANGSRDFRRLAGLLRLPHDVLGKWGYAKPVWHCSMRAAPEDRLLSDREWAGIAGGCDAPHRAVPARGGRRRGAVDRDPARPGPHPPGGDAGPPGPGPPPHRERTLPGPRRLPGRRAAVRAAVHRPGRPHRGPPPVPRRDRQSRPPRARRATPDHPAPPRLHRRRIRRQRGGVLRPAGPGRDAGPAPVQRDQTPARSPGTPSRCPATPPGTANRSGTEAASSPPTCPGPGSPSGGPARPGRTRR